MRTTCLYCEQEGRTTQLVAAGPHMACPIHSGPFIEAIRRNALATLGLPPRPVLLKKGVARR